jgi:hypothetical protein
MFQTMPMLENNRLTRILRRAVEFSLTPVNATITMCLRTHKSRWAKVATEVPSWDERNKLIAGFIPENVSVVDLGSGARTLKLHLKPGCEYQPCDVVQSAPEVLLCDFNSAIYPNLTRHYDYVVCSGILEYMRDPADFLSRIQTYGETILLSYNPLFPAETKVSRLGKGWVNHFTLPQLETLFGTAGLKSHVLMRRDPHEVTFQLTRAARG